MVLEFLFTIFTDYLINSRHRHDGDTEFHDFFFLVSHQATQDFFASIPFFYKQLSQHGAKWMAKWTKKVCVGL